MLMHGHIGGEKNLTSQQFLVIALEFMAYLSPEVEFMVTVNIIWNSFHYGSWSFEEDFGNFVGGKNRKYKESSLCPITCSKKQFSTPLISVYKHWERRNPEMLLAPAGEKKILSSMNWPSCCHFLQPSLASLTRRPSFDLQLAIWKWGILLTKGTLRGTCEWKALHQTHQ